MPKSDSVQKPIQIPDLPSQPWQLVRCQPLPNGHFQLEVAPSHDTYPERVKLFGEIMDAEKKALAEFRATHESVTTWLAAVEAERQCHREIEAAQRQAEELGKGAGDVNEMLTVIDRQRDIVRIREARRPQLAKAVAEAAVLMEREATHVLRTVCTALGKAASARAKGLRDSIVAGAAWAADLVLAELVRDTAQKPERAESLASSLAPDMSREARRADQAAAQEAQAHADRLKAAAAQVEAARVPPPTPSLCVRQVSYGERTR